MEYRKHDLRQDDQRGRREGGRAPGRLERRSWERGDRGRARRDVSLLRIDWGDSSSTQDRKPPNGLFLAESSCRDRALLVLGSNTAKQAVLTAVLDPSTHFRPPLTHTSHHRPALVDLSRFIAVSGVTHSRFRRFSTCVSAVSGVSLVGVSLLSADVAVAVVRPEVISQRVFISRGRTRAHWKALVKAHTIVQ